MTVDMLKTKIKENQIPYDWYFLGGYGDDDQKFCLIEENGKWLVYFSERGRQFDLQEHDNEDAACDDLFERLIDKLNFQKNYHNN